MAKVDVYKGYVAFRCPGCDTIHSVPVAPENPNRWKFNGLTEKPTLHPSILVAKDELSRRCHLFVRDGEIIYLSDCHHDMKGMTVPMEDVGELFHRPDWDNECPECGRPVDKKCKLCELCAARYE
ncbi:MAG: DUF6527 family protein [Sphaerochaetaceae bacterium]